MERFIEKAKDLMMDNATLERFKHDEMADAFVDNAALAIFRVKRGDETDDQYEDMEDFDEIEAQEIEYERESQTVRTAKYHRPNL